MNDPVTVVIADAQPLFRDGLRAALDADHAIVVVGEAATADHAVQLTEALRPRLAVIDVELRSGADATSRIVDAGHTKVLILTASRDDADVLAALRAGATGFLRKDAAPAMVRSAAHAVAAGRSMIASGVTASLFEGFAAVADEAVAGAAGPRLTSRELDVLRLVASGASTGAIAEELAVSAHTVRNHVRGILAALSSGSRIEAVAYAVRAGMLPSD